MTNIDNNFIVVTLREYRHKTKGRTNWLFLPANCLDLPVYPYIRQDLRAGYNRISSHQSPPYHLQCVFLKVILLIFFIDRVNITMDKTIGVISPLKLGHFRECRLRLYTSNLYFGTFTSLQDIKIHDAS